MDTTLDDGYRAMAADKEREAEALEWCNALAGDIKDEPQGLTNSYSILPAKSVRGYSAEK